MHHGYFWRGEDPRLVGPRGWRIAALNAAQLNPFAYPLPLDAHPGIGNNAESETGQTPHERYHREPRLLRQVDLGAVLTFFHRRVPRKVDRDFSDVRLENLFFAVDPTLRGDQVIVEYDPFSA